MQFDEIHVILRPSIYSHLVGSSIVVGVAVVEVDEGGGAPPK